MKLQKWAKYVARDKNGTLWAFSEKPQKDLLIWKTEDTLCEKLDSGLFPYIKWSDEEPTEIHKSELEDMVNHPSHYNQGGIETLDIIKMSLTKEEYKGYLKGNVLKYRERAQFKGNAEQDYAKAKFYFDELESRRE